LAYEPFAPALGVPFESAAPFVVTAMLGDRLEAMHKMYSDESKRAESERVT